MNLSFMMLRENSCFKLCSSAIALHSSGCLRLLSRSARVNNLSLRGARVDYRTYQVRKLAHRLVLCVYCIDRTGLVQVGLHDEVVKAPNGIFVR